MNIIKMLKKLEEGKKGTAGIEMYADGSGNVFQHNGVYNIMLVEFNNIKELKKYMRENSYEK